MADIPSFILADLYKNDLVLIQENAPSSTDETQITNKSNIENTDNSTLKVKTAWYLGENRRNISVIIKDSSAVYINDEWLATLGKLLEALKANLADIAIINLQNFPGTDELMQVLEPRTILIFDATTSEAGFPFAVPHYQVQNYGKCKIMSAPGVTLSSTKTDADINQEKRKLWTKLQTLF